MKRNNSDSSQSLYIADFQRAIISPSFLSITTPISIGSESEISRKWKSLNEKQTHLGALRPVLSTVSTILDEDWSCQNWFPEEENFREQTFRKKFYNLFRTLTKKFRPVITFYQLQSTSRVESFPRKFLKVIKNIVCFFGQRAKIVGGAVKKAD